jgi:protein involved in polysaccharide export with SLBB domain
MRVDAMQRAVMKISIKMFASLLLFVCLMSGSTGVWAATKPGAAAKAGAAARPIAAAKAGVASKANTTARVDADYVIGPDDVLEVTVLNHDDLNKMITVRPDGKFAFPYAGEVKAAGRTARSLAAELQARLSRDLNHATVMIAVKEVHARSARVLGAVKTAGTYEIKPNFRVMDLVALAGGLSTKPVRISGRIIRNKLVIPLPSIEQAVQKPDSSANVRLQPDDLVILDEQDITKQVSVTGQVDKPGAYDLEEGLTILSLLAQAGGPKEGAALRKVHVLRGAAQIPFDLYPVIVDRETDESVTKFRFKAGDVLVVPEIQARYGVMGQVAKPGYFYLPEKDSEATVLKALALAGGPLQGAGGQEDAGLQDTTITRITDGKATVIPVDLQAMLEEGAPDSVALQPNDVLFIPKANNQVHVIGQVAKPGAYELKKGLTLMSLVSEAGSPTKGAGLGKSYVLRQSTQVPVNLRAVLIDGKPDQTVMDFHLQRGDVLVIPDVSDQVHVTGEVTKPGVFNLDDNLTVISLLAQAGNPTEKAALTKAYVLRRGVQIPLDLHDLLVERNPNAAAINFKFESGDALVVPENKVRYGVMGQVAKPGFYPFPEKKGDATVLKALGEAGGQATGGVDQGGDLRGAGIIRIVNGTPTLIKVNIEDALRRGKLAGNIELQPEDVLYIPPRRKKFDWGTILNPLNTLSLMGVRVTGQ